MRDVERRADRFEDLDLCEPQVPRDDLRARIRACQRTKRKKNTTASTIRYQPNALNAFFFTNARKDLMATIAALSWALGENDALQPLVNHYQQAAAGIRARDN